MVETENLFVSNTILPSFRYQLLLSISQPMAIAHNIIMQEILFFINACTSL